MIIRCIRCRKEDRGFDFTIAIQPSPKFDICDRCVKEILKTLSITVLMKEGS